jgi:adenine deaminase
VVKGAKVFNPYLGIFQEGDLAVAAGRVAGIGSYEGLETIDAQGGYLIAGLIDSHVHVESSMAGPLEFARAVSAAGVAAVVADPHEIANVAGLAGVRWLLEASENLPVDVFVMAPSCVPATPLERGGAELGPEEIAALLSHPRVLGLAEMMNYPGVLAGDPGVLAKMSGAALVDGHAPGLSGAALAAYAGAGIRTDHECLAPEEALERLALGQRVLLREGTAAKNLLSLLPALTPDLARFCHLCTDDRHAGDLAGEGSINHLLALAASSGLLPIASILRMATLNPAEHYGLADLGSLAPGRLASMALYPDLEGFKPLLAWKAGRLVAEGGLSTFPSTPPAPGPLEGTVRPGPLSSESLALPAAGREVRVIGVVPGQIVTESLRLAPKTSGGLILADPDGDVAKLAVWDRYGRGLPPAVGLIRGLGLRRGAIGTTVSHDSHNLAVAGASDGDMILCAKALAEAGGGLAAAEGGKILGLLPLPLGGLMSGLTIEETAKGCDLMAGLAKGLGCQRDPFMTLSFMSLPVIPKLKLTASGLVDVEAFKVVETAVGEERP